MSIQSAKYINQIIDYENNTKVNTMIKAVIGGDTMFVPLDTANRHYQAILEWAEDGNTIEDAD
jgi:hypothetical protein